MDVVLKTQERFSKQFQEGTLKDVKFFIDPKSGVIGSADLFDEISRIEDALAAGSFTVVESIDGHLPQKRFDAPF